MAKVGMLADVGKFLRLHTAEGDASELTVRSYFSDARQFAGWRQEQGMSPAMATEGIDGRTVNPARYLEAVMGCQSSRRRRAATWLRWLT